MLYSTDSPNNVCLVTRVNPCCPSNCTLDNLVSGAQVSVAGEVITVAYYLTRHRRRNQGGTGGTCPPNQQGRGQCPNSQNNACTCLIGLTMQYSRTSSYKVCSDRLTVRFFIATTKKLRPDTVIHAKRAWFTPQVGVVAKILRALRAQILQCPPSSYTYARLSWSEQLLLLVSLIITTIIIMI